MFDYESKLFKIDIESKNAQSGSILVAEPFLRDVYFNHAVIQMIDCNPGQTAMGVVLNQATDYKLQQLIGSVSRKDPVTVYCGGPMSRDRIFYMHTLGDLLEGSRAVTDDLYIGGNFESMLKYINAGYPVDGHIRFFLGYSGWSPGQLDQELHDHVWGVSDPVPSSLLMNREGDAMWHDMVRYLGPAYNNWRYHPKNVSAN